MDERVQAVAERARAAGNARPKAEVTTRRVPPASIQPPDFRERGLTERACKRPDCPVKFKPTSPNQRYHEPRCRELHVKAKKRRVDERPPPPQPDTVSAAPAPSGKNETRENSAEEIGWATVDRFLELLFAVASDTDDDAAVRVSALELLDGYVGTAVGR